MSEPLILASASPRRRDLLAGVGVALEIVPADVDESVLPGELADDYVARVAAAKADAIARQRPGRWVLGADTTVTVDGAILGKAADDDAARSMLRALLGRAHRVATGFSVRGPGGVCDDQLVITEVWMRAVGEPELDAYIAAGEWRGKAGAYAIQGAAVAMVREVRGSVTNVIGLPVAEVLDCLAALGGPGAPG
ncbi:MAG: Maf family nucleotide pyrophosphatase [Haliangiales bacterium]